MKNILFVTYDFPYPTNTGGKNRAYHMLKYSGKEFKKYLFSFVRPDFKSSNISKLEEIGVEVLGLENRRKTSDLRNISTLVYNQSIFKSLYYSKKVHKELLRIIQERKIDIVHFESYYTAFYISDEIKKLGVKQVYGSENIEFQLYKKFASNKSFGFLLNSQVEKIKNEEIEMYKKSDAVVTVTEEEKEFASKYSKKVFVVPNGIDTDAFEFEKNEKEVAKNLLFVGNFTYFPNVEAIEDFYKNIFVRLPVDIELTVIGKSVMRLSFIKDSRIKAVEYIPNIKDAYQDADILVSPVKIGGGTNFKVLEAMAAGVPVVAYEDRSEAVGGEDEQHMMVARDDEEFRSSILELISDLPKRQKIAKAARKFVEEKYSWKKIGKELASVWENL